MTELKRLDSVSRSPVFDCFSASLKGITPIRAFGRQEASQRRIVTLLQRNAEAWFWWLITNRFIGFRLDMLSALIMAIATFGGAALRDLISPELVGLAIVNTISLSGLFQFMVRQSAMVESFMTSFERLLAYSRLTTEASLGSTEPSQGFPSGGAIKVAGLRMRYREDLPEVLKGVNFECAAGVKVGVCGRTGSGKSSIFMALARLTENTAGSITIDGTDVSKLHLQALRRCIAWVPQEPNFFSGSLRLNLDPFGLYSDESIQNALRSVQMTEAIGGEGLQTTIAEGGSNFSIGERQLLSLARALLQKRKILCMDEAFANVDFATDSKVQSAVRAVAEETGATVMVVAHRMMTLADSDYVVVMDDGVVAEHGHPKELLQKGGAYATMVQHAEMQENEVDEKHAQEEYEQFVEDSATKRADDSKLLAEKEGVQADTIAALEKNSVESKDTLRQEMANDKYISDLHAECDWLIQNFETRVKARAGEVESLKNAKAVLSGSDYSLLQTRNAHLRGTHA